MDTPRTSTLESSLAASLGESVTIREWLGYSSPKRAIYAAEGASLGQLVLKLRLGDRAVEKTQWSAEHLPRLAKRGYPAPSILWHGMVDTKWHAVVLERLPGSPVGSLDSERVDALLALVELQADAEIHDGEREERNFGAYVSNVLFDDWDPVWQDAASASPAAAAICDRLRPLLVPVWGHQITGRDYAHNDLNLTNVLTDEATITGIVDWDEFGINNRATDLLALAFDCIRLQQEAITSPGDATAKVLERAFAVSDEATVRCLVAYLVIGHLASRVRRGDRQVDRSIEVGHELIRLTS